MKNFMVLATAFVLGHFVALGLVGCNADANKPPIPTEGKAAAKEPAKDAAPVEAPKSDAK